MENYLSISRFWARVWALLFDGLILGVFGYILGLFFDNYFITLGGNGRLIGWVISLIYFTTLNSKIGNGQTLGKKAMMIQVADINGNPLDLKKSFIRALILTAPYFLNGYSIPGSESFSIIVFIQTLVIFVLGIGIILFYILNTETRQSVHDIIVKSYVVEQYRNEEPNLMPQYSKIPMYVLCVIAILTTSLYLYSIYTVKPSNSELKKLKSVYEAISSQENISSVKVYQNTKPIIDSVGLKHNVYTVVTTGNKKIRSYADTSYCYNLPEIKQTVQTFIQSDAYTTDEDILNLIFISGYDIGICSSETKLDFYQTISQWKSVYNL